MSAAGHYLSGGTFFICKSIALNCFNMFIMIF